MFQREIGQVRGNKLLNSSTFCIDQNMWLIIYSFVKTSKYPDTKYDIRCSPTDYLHFTDVKLRYSNRAVTYSSAIVRKS